MIKILTLINFVFLAGISFLIAATSVTTNGITFQFDGDYQVGRFVDGEPWVIENFPGEGVRITAISPDYFPGHNGYDVNRTDSYGNSLDDRINGGFKQPQPLPKTYGANSAILKVESLDPTYEDCRKVYNVKTCIKQASVLLVLATVPPANSFRPPYAGKDKPLFSANLDLSGLPQVPEVAGQVSLSDAEAVFAGGVWLDNVNSSRNSYGHTADAMRRIGGGCCATYGSNLAISITTAMLRTMHNNTDEEKRYLANRIIQYAIDTYYLVLTGMTYPANGGIFGGRKAPILYAGKLLNHSGMMNIGNTHNGNIFQEDGYHYYGVHGEALWGMNTCGSGRYLGGGKVCRDPEGIVDGGYCNGGPYCDTYSSGSSVSQPSLDQQRETGLYAYAPYQNMTGQYYGAAAVGHLLGVEEEWNHPSFFDYVERLGKPPWNYYCGNYCSDYLTNMYKYSQTNPTAISSEENQFSGTFEFKTFAYAYNKIEVPFANNGQQVILYDIYGAQIAIGEIRNRQITGNGFNHLRPGVFFLQVSEKEVLHKIIIF